MPPLSDEQRRLVEEHLGLAYWLVNEVRDWARECLFLSDPDDVSHWLEDYAVDALLQCAQNYDGSSGFKHWVTISVERALRRCIRDYTRDCKRQPTVWQRRGDRIRAVSLAVGSLDEEDRQEPASPEPSPEELAVVQDFLDRLPDLHARIVALLDGGCTQDDVAEILDTNQMFVSRRLAEVRTAMMDWQQGREVQIVEDGASLARHLERRLPVRLSVRAVNANTLSVSDGEVERQLCVALPADVNAVIDRIREAFGLGKGKS